MADRQIHHAHGLAELILVMQHGGKAGIDLGVVRIQQPGLIEAAHRHAQLVGLIEAVSLRHPRPRRLVGGSKRLNCVRDELFIAGLKFGGSRSVHAAVHRQFVDAWLRLRCRRRLDGASRQPQAGNQQ
ncbi:hypothetical protein D3C87_1859130 [compost metagenome]